MVRRLVIIRMSVSVIPDDGNVVYGKRSIVASSHRTVPRAVIRLQFQPVTGNVILEPLAQCRMCFRIEIHHVLGLFRPIVPANHIKIQIPFDILYKIAVLHEILRA